MMTDAMKNKVRIRSEDFRLPIPEFEENGVILFERPTPILDKVTKAFPFFQVVDFGRGPMKRDRPDDKREVFWVEVRAEEW